MKYDAFDMVLENIERILTAENNEKIEEINKNHAKEIEKKDEEIEIKDKEIRKRNEMLKRKSKILERKDEEISILDDITKKIKQCP